MLQMKVVWMGEEIDLDATGGEDKPTDAASTAFVGHGLKLVIGYEVHEGRSRTRWTAAYRFADGHLITAEAASAQEAVTELEPRVRARQAN